MALLLNRVPERFLPPKNPLPFYLSDNFSAEADTEYLSDWLDRSNHRCIVARARPEVGRRQLGIHFKGRKDIGKSARRWHVSKLLEGSVRKVGKQIALLATY